jgi:TP901 family phage tail tape measure protein
MDDLRLQFEVRDDGTVVLKKIRDEHDKTVESVKRGSGMMATAISDLRKKLPSTGEAFSNLADKVVNSLQRMAKIGTAAVIALSVASVKAAADFQYGMAEVATLVDTSIVNMSELSAGILELSSKYGQSAKIMTRGLYETLSAGVQASDALKLMEVASEAAVAGITSVNTAVDALTTMLNSYGLGVEHARRISDEMFVAVVEGKLVFENIANSIGKASTMSAQLGVSSADLMAALATLTKVGLDVDMALTSIKAIYNSLLSPTSDAIAAAHAYGVELHSAVLAEKGFAGYMEHVKSQLSKVTSSQREYNEALSRMFPNVRAITGVMALSGNALGEFERITDKTRNTIDNTRTAFEKVADTATNAWNRLKTTFKGEMIKWGTEAIETVTDVIEHLVSNADKYFGLIKETGKNLVEVFKAVVTAFTGLHPELDKAHAKMTTVEKVAYGLTSAFAAINVTLSTIGLAVTYIGGAFQAVSIVVKGILFLLITAAELIGGLVHVVGTVLGGAFNAVAESIKYVFWGALEWILKIVDTIRKVISGIVSTLNKVDIVGLIPDEVVSLLKKPISIETVTTKRQEAGTAAGEAWTIGGQQVIADAQKQWSDFTMAVSADSSVLGTAAYNLGTGLAYATQNASDARHRITDAMQSIKQAAERTGGATKEAYDAVGRATENILEGMKRQAQSAEEQVKLMEKALAEATKQREQFETFSETYDRLTAKYNSLGEAISKNEFVLTMALNGYDAATMKMDELIKILYGNVESVKVFGDVIQVIRKATSEGSKDVVEYYQQQKAGEYKTISFWEGKKIELTSKVAEGLVKIDADTAARRIKQLQELDKKEKEDAITRLQERYNDMKARHIELQAATYEMENSVGESINRVVYNMVYMGDSAASLADVLGNVAENIKGSVQYIEGLKKRAAEATGGGAGYQGGGLVRGFGEGDRQGIHAEAGEFVVQRPAVQHLGIDVLETLNQLSIPRGEKQSMTIEVVLVPSEEYIDQVITRGSETIFGLIEANPKRIRKSLKV